MKILFGVFDWGLGHATRDIPLIEALLKEKNTVHILSTGRSLKVLKNYFSEKCIYHEVPSIYHIYDNKCTSFEVALNTPKLLTSLKKVRKISKKIIEIEKFDKVISDCRYDVYDKKDNSYLINHQLRFKAPIGIEHILELWLASRMKKYKFVFVPDYRDENLTGLLSHKLKYLPKEKIQYIGILSHIKKKNMQKNIDYFISLSGPEQTRIELEKNILAEIKNLKGKIIIAGGNPDIEKNNISKNIIFYSYLETKKQEEMMNRAKFIIVRAGYTTIMELAELNKNALLIPSPSQPEQEYLVKHLKKHGFFHFTNQSKLNLIQDINKSKEYRGFNPPWKTNDSIKKFIKLLNL